MKKYFNISINHKNENYPIDYVIYGSVGDYLLATVIDLAKNGVTDFTVELTDELYKIDDHEQTN